MKQSLIPLSTEIRCWRADIRLMDSACEHSKAAILVYAWNWATSPTALRTDREHKTCRRFARWAMRRLERAAYHKWWESESGKLRI